MFYSIWLFDDVTIIFQEDKEKKTISSSKNSKDLLKRLTPIDKTFLKEYEKMYNFINKAALNK